MSEKKSRSKVRGLGLILVATLLLAALGACRMPKGGPTTSPPT